MDEKSPKSDRGPYLVYSCPFCIPNRIMNISTVNSALFGVSSTVTFVCHVCGYQEQISHRRDGT